MFGQNKDELTVEETSTSFAEWINKPYVPATLQPQLAQANVLIVPWENFRNLDIPVFPEGTAELFRFLQERAGDGFAPEVCIDDQDYKELALHSDLYQLAAIVTQVLAGPLLINLIYDFVKSKRHSKEDRLKIEITVVDPGERSFRIRYEGPVDDFQAKVLPRIDEIANKTGKQLTDAKRQKK